MANALQVYKHTVEPLAPGERLRLAALILEGLTEEVPGPEARVSMADLIATLPPGPRACSSWDDYEHHLQEERNAWDR
jgi:hypothetical protein